MKQTEKIAQGLMRLNAKAVMEVNNGNYVTALGLFEQAYEFECKLKLDGPATESLVNVANVHYLMGEYDKALELLEQARLSFSRHNSKRGVYRVKQLAGEIYYRKGVYDKAVKCFDECLRLNCGLSENGVALFQLATVALSRGNIDQAINRISSAIISFERANDIQHLIESLEQRAQLFEQTRRESLAHTDRNRIEYYRRTE